MSFEEQYNAGRFQPASRDAPFSFDSAAKATSMGAVGHQSHATAAGQHVDTTATQYPRGDATTIAPSGPHLYISKAIFGAGTNVVDVTSTMQQLVYNKGGLTLDAFGQQSTKKMSALFGDPCPGVRKQLVIYYEVLGTPKKITKKEDYKMTFMMDHIYPQGTGKSPAPEEVKLFCVDIIKATYGLDKETCDVTSVLRGMVSEHGGKGLQAFGYKIKPNGCMNKVFGDPCPGSDKILQVEYSWRTPLLTQTVDEDKRLYLNFEPLRSLL